MSAPLAAGAVLSREAEILVHRPTLTLLCASLLLLPRCGPPEAKPDAMREAAMACGFERWAVAPSNDAAQSPYALHFDSAQAGIAGKLDCYEQRLSAMGLEPTLGVGSAGFDARTDDGLLFARVTGACRLPPEARITQEEGRIMIYGASDLPRQTRECASRRLRAAGRFSKVEFSRDPPPRPPRVDL